MPYTILGLDDGPGGNVELHDESTEKGAEQWIALYTNRGNWGGYYGLAVIRPDGSWGYVTPPRDD